jgi:hypothetical protein
MVHSEFQLRQEWATPCTAPCWVSTTTKLCKSLPVIIGTLVLVYLFSLESKFSNLVSMPGPGYYFLSNGLLLDKFEWYWSFSFITGLKPRASNQKG